jgi:hypothetical protein
MMHNKTKRRSGASFRFEIPTFAKEELGCDIEFFNRIPDRQTSR